MTLTERLHQYFLESAGVSTDTRQDLTNKIFFALKGENFNGNLFAEKAIEAGANYVVLDEKQPIESPKIIYVENALEALQTLANLHRKYLNVPVVAITGSNGKTTCKELIYSVLKTVKSVHATPGNFNNHIGLPLTVLSAPKNVEIILLEMGDNKKGDVTELCQIAEPDLGFITNIGKDHLEGFGGMQGNIEAKKELFDYFSINEGTALLNKQDKQVLALAEHVKNKIVFGEHNTENTVELVEVNPTINYKDNNNKVTSTNLIGDYNFSNIQFAFAIGKYFQVPTDKINLAIADYTPTNNRSQIKDTATNTLLLDAYNANPSSVEAALKSFSRMETPLNKACILGDMLEVGSTSSKEHQQIIDLAISLNLEKVFFIGPNYYEHRLIQGESFFKKKEDFEEYLKNNQINQYFILLKASRGVKLETLENLL